jgi:heparanase 1
MRRAGLFFVFVLLAARASISSEMKAVPITPATLPRIAIVDERYQSYNVEIAEVIGGKFWKPYDKAALAEGPKPKRPQATPSGSTSPTQVGADPSMFQARPPVDLTNARLRTLAAALGPAYVRVSGSWANSMYFHDEDTPPPSSAPKGFDGVLTRRQWRGVIDFARAVNARLVTSFAISAGVRDAAGVWTPVEARKLMRYTHDIGGHIDAAEMFNEPDMPTYAGAPAGYTAQNYAQDLAVFASFIRSAAPDMRIVGPGSVSEGLLGPQSAKTMPGFISTEAMMTATPRPAFDVFSYHFYPAVSVRCAGMGAAAQTTRDAALSEEWLARTDRGYAFYVTGIRDRYEPGKAVWITETAESACGGNPWANTFLDTFRYIDQMGRLARRGVNVIFHNTLASSEYGLLDQRTFQPRPNYWVALLWRRLMGTTVLDAGPSRPGLHQYAHCLRGHPGGVTLLLINNSRTTPSSVELPTPSERFTLSAHGLEDTEILLNDTALRLGAGDELPALNGKPTSAGRVVLPAATITFLVLSNAGNLVCQ